MERLTRNKYSERIFERLNAAFSEGRLIELPIKLGTKVFYVTPGPYPEICPAKVVQTEQRLNTPSCPHWITVRYKSKVIGTQECHQRYDLLIGKTVFLTRDDAEAALKARAGK